MREWRSWSPAITVLVAAVFAGQVVAATNGTLRPYILGLTVLVLDVLGAVISLRAARHGDAIAWRLIAVGRMSSVLAVIALGVYSFSGHQLAWWFGVCGRLGLFVFLAVAVVFAPAKRLGGRQRMAFVAEAVTVLSGGFMVVWYLVINPAIDGTSPSLAWVEDIGYPIGDLLLLMAVVVILVLRGTRDRRDRPMIAFAGGLGFYLVGDAFWSSVDVGGRHLGEDNPVIGFCMVIASLLMTLSAIFYRRLPAAVRADRRDRQDSRWSAYLPVIALVIGGTLMVVVTINENDMLPWGGLVLGLITMAAAIAARQMISQRESRDLIVSDPLTGLANRTGLDNAIARAARRQEPVTLLLIDLDGFKPVNDAYGHAAGDTVLIEFAHHLRAVVRTGDVAARIGGDEFAVLLTEVETAEHAGSVAQRILTTAAANPVRLGEDTLPVRASIGLTTGAPGDTMKDLLRRADVAMYQAKRAGTHGWRAYDPSMTDRRAEDAALSEDLDRALDRGELHVLYQPIVNLDSGDPIAVEALLRWQHPVHGLVSPVRFIPIAERTGAIGPIGLWVLEQACAQLAGRDLHLSVNLSPRQLQEPTLIFDILGVLRRTGMPADRLVLEVTESAIVDQDAIAVLTDLRGHGIRIAVDDFGTGYSSLHYLTRLPVDVLKIDRSFVAELDGTPEGSAITEAVIRLAQVLHLRVVAEGIETPAQAAELQLLGCGIGQGYLFARPLPANELSGVRTV